MGNDDPLAALMAPPPSRGMSSMKRDGTPMASMSAGGGGVPPVSPMRKTPTYAVFQPIENGGS